MAKADEKKKGKKEETPKKMNPFLTVFLSFGFFVSGTVIAYAMGLKTELPFFDIHPALGLVVSSLAIFLFSLLYFGNLNPFFMVLIGLMYSRLLEVNPLLLVAYGLPFLAAAYAGMIFGNSINEDFKGKANLFANKAIVLWLAAAILLALIVGFAQPYLPQLPGITELEPLYRVKLALPF